jgi:hypothetical protein
MLKKVSHHSWIASVFILLQQQICFSQAVSTTQPMRVDPEVNSILQTSSQSIFNFPLNNRNTVKTQSPHHEYLWMQTQHERPIAYGIQQSWLHRSELWRRLDEATNSATSWRDIRHRCKLNTCQEPKILIEQLHKQGFEKFVLHLNFIPTTQHTTQTFLWAEIFGDPIVQSEAHIVYQIGSKENGIQD